MDGNSAIQTHRAPVAAGVLWLLFAWTGSSSQAATVHKCTDPYGKTTFSDQPCAIDERADEVDIHGQPLIGGPGSAPDPDPDTDPETVVKGQPQEPVEEDVRAPRLRRLDYLLNQLFTSLNTAGNDCKRATTGINAWIKRYGNETRGLYADWNEIKYEKLALKQKELEVMRRRLNRQVAKLRSEALPKLNAKCWNDRQLGAAFDRLQPYLPGN